MELPCEIWEKIILQNNDAKQCIKLFKSLPKLTQKNIREVFDNHIKSIQNKILYSVNNSMILAVENQNITIFEDNYAENQIKFIRYMKSESGENEYFISVDKKGTIIFWDTKTYKFIDSIEIGNEIQNIEFHPSKTKLVVSLIKENLGLEIQSLTLTTHGIIFNETIIGYEPEFLIEIVYHPTLP
jgi:WD40 repeat protein